MLAANHSSYPRIGDTPPLQKLRRVIEATARNEAPRDTLVAAQEEMTRLALKEQAETDLDLLTDGQIRWYDGVWHFASNFDGVSAGSIFRFFDTNFLIRQPVVQGRVRWRGTLTAPEYRFAARAAKKPVKAVLTGPVTLARHSILADGAYKSPRDLAIDYATGLQTEARDLFAAGAAWLQVEEPSILTHPEDLPVLRDFLAGVAKDKPAGAQVLLATYFNDAAPLYAKLLELPVGGFVWDLTYSETLADRIAQGFSKVLGLGIVDGRNTMLEKPEDIARRVERIAAKARGEVHLLPSCGLEHLPRDRARQKLEILAKARTYLTR